MTMKFKWGWLAWAAVTSGLGFVPACGGSEFLDCEVRTCGGGDEGGQGGEDAVAGATGEAGLGDRGGSAGKGGNGEVGGSSGVAGSHAGEGGGGGVTGGSGGDENGAVAGTGAGCGIGFIEREAVCVPVLASLSLSGGILNEAFDPNVTEYATSINANVTTVTATTEAADAEIAINGEVTSSLEVDLSDAAITPITVTVTAGGESSTYEVVTTRFGAQEAYVKASNTETYDGFGSAVALSRDGNTLAVGAYQESAGVGLGEDDNSAEGAGAVYVYVREAGGWRQQQYLKASNADAADRFGQAVALSGDGATLVVGAPGERSAATGVDGNRLDNSRQAAGAAYVFRREGSLWSETAYLKASNPDEGDNFGAEVDISGDANVIAVGGSGEGSANGSQSNNELMSAGAVYVFTSDGESWQLRSYLKPAVPGNGDAFGGTLALSASGSTLVVGAEGEDGGLIGVEVDDSAENAGAAYVFQRSGSSWTQQAYLKAADPTSNGYFASDVGVSADGELIVVGARSDDSGATTLNGDPYDDSAPGSGAAYVFARDGSTWHEQAYLKASDASDYDALGWAVAIADDGTLVVAGAYREGDLVGEDPALLGSGSAYVFSNVDGTWEQQVRLKASNAGNADEFASKLALAGDASVLAATAPSEDGSGIGVNGPGQADNSASEAGAAYLFRF
jgi:hypothetical protein